MGQSSSSSGCCSSAVMAELEGSGLVYEALNRSVMEREELVWQITAH